MMQYDPSLIVTADNRAAVLRYLRMADWPEASLAVASNVELANMYHTGQVAPSPDAIQRATAAAVLATMAALREQHGTIDEARIIELIERHASQSRRLEVITERGSVTIDVMMHYRTELVIKIASMGHPIMLVGPAGCGKTTIGEHVALALQLSFYITNVINDPHELLGFIDGYGKYHATPFRIAFQNGGLWLADEIDAWDAAALLTANSALANGYAQFPDCPNRVQRHPDFRMVATANTYGTGADRVYVGRNELDAASLDRFAPIAVDYDTTLERMFAGPNDRWLERVWQVRRAIMTKRVRHIVSSRAIAMGSAALSIGIDWDDVEEIYLWKGIAEKDRKMIDA